MNAVPMIDIGLCWTLFPTLRPAELVETAARHGFPTITLAADAVLTWREESGEAALRRRLADTGVRVRLVDGLGAGLPGMSHAPVRIGGREIARPDAETCFRAAMIVETPLVSATLNGAAPVPHAQLVDGIAAAARTAAGQDLAIAFEFIPDSPVPDLRAARALVEACATTALTILLDPWHLARSGGTVADIAALPPGMIGALQLCDRIEPPPGTPYVPMTGRLPPGEGELPLAAITRAALANRRGLTAELEIFSEELRALAPEAVAIRLATAVRRWRAEN